MVRKFRGMSGGQRQRVMVLGTGRAGRRRCRRSDGGVVQLVVVNYL